MALQESVVLTLTILKACLINKQHKMRLLISRPDIAPLSTTATTPLKEAVLLKTSKSKAPLPSSQIMLQ